MFKVTDMEIFIELLRQCEGNLSWYTALSLCDSHTQKTCMNLESGIWTKAYIWIWPGRFLNWHEMWMKGNNRHLPVLIGLVLVVHTICFFLLLTELGALQRAEFFALSRYFIESARRYGKLQKHCKKNVDLKLLSPSVRRGHLVQWCGAFAITHGPKQPVWESES